MSDNPFIKKVGKNEYRCLFGVNDDEGNRIGAGGGSGLSSYGDKGVTGHRVTHIDGAAVGSISGNVNIIYDCGENSRLNERCIPTVVSLIKASRAVKVKIEIENPDGTVTKAELI